MTLRNRFIPRITSTGRTDADSWWTTLSTTVATRGDELAVTPIISATDVRAEGSRRRFRFRAGTAVIGILLVVSGTSLTAHAARPRCFGKPATIVGTSGNDVLRGTRRGDVIVARGGGDIIRAKEGNDRVCSGAGNDLVRGATGRDRIKGGDGQDRLVGGEGNDLIVSGFFGIQDEGQHDSLAGGDGDDTLLGSAALDAITGGAGNDVIRSRGNIQDVLYTEVVSGGRGADRIRGGTAQHSEDQIVAELFVGGPGPDIIDGGENGDGLGELDAVGYMASRRKVTVSLLDGFASGQGRDTLVRIGGVIGSSFDDVITGDGGTNLIHGMDGSDSIDAGDGDDVIDGDDFISANLSKELPIDRRGCQGICDDIIDGQGGNDTVGGAEGADRIEGSAGDDSLNGEADDDVLDGGTGTNSNDGGSGVDTCTNPDTASGAENCESP